MDHPLHRQDQQEQMEAVSSSSSGLTNIEGEVELTGQGDSVEVADSQADTTSKRSVEVANSAQMDKKAEIADSQQSDSTTSDRSLEMADSKQTDITPEQEGTNGEVEDTKKKNTTLDQQVSPSSSTIIKVNFF